MAFVKGVANGVNDLYEKLIEYLTTNAELVADGQAWSVAWRHPRANSQVVLRGPGLAGDDAVYVGISRSINADASNYWINLWGMTGVIPSASDVRGHVNVSPEYVRMYGDINPSDYWFIANGRRFMVVQKISTVFEVMYAGLILPYGTPLTYPYPLCIGGTVGDIPAGLDSWRSVDDGHSAFPFSYYSTLASFSRNPACHILGPDGEWLRCVGTHYGSSLNSSHVNIYPNKRSTAQPYFPTAADSMTIAPGVGIIESRERMAPAADGTVTMEHMHLLRENPLLAVYGVFDGVYRTIGIDNASENIITVDDVDHLVVQNTYRTSARDYLAFKLE